jgi:hypothetical protein
MSAQKKQTFKLSTLDGAQRIYYIVAGLAIRESLSVLGGGTASTASQAFAGIPHFTLARWIVGLGYLTTVLRFSHGIALLHGYETERVKSSAFPSASSGRLLTLALFMAVLSILLYLMAVNIFDLRRYLLLALAVLVLDLLYVLRSGVVRGISRGVFRLWRETQSGFPARAAVQWVFSDISLCVITILLAWATFYFYKVSGPLSTIQNLSYPAFTLLLMALYGLLLLAASLFDYIGNSAFYFGGKPARQNRRFVFICSPLRGEREENIRCAQWYCKQLIESPASIFGSELTPFAPHAFFTYFLNDDVDRERLLGRRCALAFLAACDVVYVYVPYLENRTITRRFRKRTANEADVSSGMKAEIEDAKQMGLDIRYRERISPPSEWRPSMPGAIPNRDDETKVNSKLVDEPLRRVFVCTPLQGNNWTGDLAVLRKNKALLHNRQWHNQYD